MGNQHMHAAVMSCSHMVPNGSTHAIRATLNILKTYAYSTQGWSAIAIAAAAVARGLMISAARGMRPGPIEGFTIEA